MDRTAFAIGDRVSIVGKSAVWLVVDYEDPCVVIARRGDVEAVVHPTALVVIEHAW